MWGGLSVLASLMAFVCIGFMLGKKARSETTEPLSFQLALLDGSSLQDQLTQGVSRDS